MAPLRLALLGDLQLGRLVDAICTQRRLLATPPAASVTAAATAAPPAAGGAPPPPAWAAVPWGDTLPLLLAADGVLANLETAVTTSPTPWARTPKAFHFKAHPMSALPVLAAARVRGVLTANNHVLDWEEQGLADTLRALDDAGVRHAGAGASRGAARRAAHVPCRGGATVALLGCCDHPAEWAADDGGAKPGVNLFDPFPSDEALAWAAAESAAARTAGASAVVLAAHYGPNWELRPPPEVRSFARAVVANTDVDVFLGTSAHVAQGVEVHAGRAIIYQAGDFIDDYARDPEWHNEWGALFEVSLELSAGGGRPTLAELSATPVLLDCAQTNVATGRDAARIADRLQRLSAELGTRLDPAGGGRLRWRPATAPASGA